MFPSVSSREFLLHIGTHKTGTTSFQHFLEDNERSLLSQGVLALADRQPDEPGRGHRFNITATAHHFLRPDLVTFARLELALHHPGGVEGSEVESLLVSRINESPCSKVVGSAEAFCFMRSEQEFDHLAQFLGRLNRHARFFVVFREEAEWRRSWLNEVSRSPALSEAIKTGLPDVRRVTADWYFDKAAIRRFWSRLGELVELDYGMHHDIRVNLADKMGIDTRQLRFGDWQNVTPSAFSEI